MANLNFSRKTIDLLRLLSNPVTNVRWRQYEALVAQYGRKPIERKLDELTRRGYIEHGVSAGGGWLTDKGKAVLAALDAPTEARGE